MLPNLRRYHRPKSIPEAIALLHKDSGTIVPLAGGTHLVRSGDPGVREVVDLRDLGLHYIREQQGVLRIGAMTPIQEVADDPWVLGFAQSCLAMGARWSHRSRLIRNVSTVGGELATTGPLSVLYTSLLALQAQVRMAGGEEFAVPMNIFLTKVGLGGGILTEVVIPALAAETFAVLVPLPVPNSPAPIMSVAARLTFKQGYVTDPKIALSGMSPVPQRIQAAESILEGEELTEKMIVQVGDLVTQSIEPTSDIYASADYRKEVSAFLVRRALERCRDMAHSSLK